jgi:hypothetical protein
LIKTLARKYRIRVAQVYRRYRAVLIPSTVHAVAFKSRASRWWASTARSAVGRHLVGAGYSPAVLNYNPPRIWSNRRSELVQRLLVDTCELCGSGDQVEVHHIRALKTSIPKCESSNPNGPCGWPATTVRPLSSAAPAMRVSTTRMPNTATTISTGKPDATEIGHVRFREGAVAEGPGHGHLVGGLLHSRAGPSSFNQQSLRESCRHQVTGIACTP